MRKERRQGRIIITVGIIVGIRIIDMVGGLERRKEVEVIVGAGIGIVKEIVTRLERWRKLCLLYTSPSPRD